MTSPDAEKLWDEYTDFEGKYIDERFGESSAPPGTVQKAFALWLRENLARINAACGEDPERERISHIDCTSHYQLPCVVCDKPTGGRYMGNHKPVCYECYANAGPEMVKFIEAAPGQNDAVPVDGVDVPNAIRPVPERCDGYLPPTLEQAIQLKQWADEIGTLSHNIYRAMDDAIDSMEREIPDVLGNIYERSEPAPERCNHKWKRVTDGDDEWWYCSGCRTESPPCKRGSAPVPEREPPKSLHHPKCPVSQVVDGDPCDPCICDRLKGSEAEPSESLRDVVMTLLWNWDIRSDYWEKRLRAAVAAEPVMRPEVEQLRMKLEAETNRRKKAEKEAFTLAINQCHDGYGDDRGHHRCREVDRLEQENAELEAERDEWRTKARNVVEWYRNVDWTSHVDADWFVHELDAMAELLEKDSDD